VATIETREQAPEHGPEQGRVTLTARAAEKIKALMAQEPAGEAEVLRVAIQGGGCSGFEYALGFDRGAVEGDHELEYHGVRLVVDPFSAPYLAGATVDYLETIQESGFKIENPNAVSSCGCGHSFQVAEGEELPEGTELGGCGSGCSH
jgi:iron-sulfur cluster assembly protein